MRRFALEIALEISLIFIPLVVCLVQKVIPSRSRDSFGDSALEWKRSFVKGFLERRKRSREPRKGCSLDRKLPAARVIFMSAREIDGSGSRMERNATV